MGIATRGQGENNAGTDDYWELLGRCAATWNGPNTTLLWKVRTLEVLREKGIWLADACIHACMNPRRNSRWRNLASNTRTRSLYKDLIDLSWRYVRPMIESADEIWYIGKNLKSTLRDDILDTQKYIPQPAAQRNPTVRIEYAAQRDKLIGAINNVCV